ncbi:MAG TPA: hypothetical protein VKE69_05265, partial [Planctomycetota bacterium]|nr:hypothetical protein [Planctomycetota bacterium]
MARRTNRRALEAALIGLALAGCETARGVINAPVDAFKSVFGIDGDDDKKTDRPNPAALQVDMQRFADDVVVRTSTALDEYVAKAGNPEARRKALRWKAQVANASISIASGPNPIANIVDFQALATFMRGVVEKHAEADGEGDALEPIVATARALEEEAWTLGGGVLGPKQQDELRQAIEEWKAANPEEAETVLARPRELTTVIRRVAAQRPKRSDPTSVFGIIGLDPIASLDPAVREVTRTRLFAERALFAIQRMPVLVRLQADVLADETLGKPEVADAVSRAMDTAERVGVAAESVSRVAEELPDRVATERKAIFDAFEKNEAPLRELTVEARKTIGAATELSASLKETLGAFDDVAERLGAGREHGSATAVDASAAR